MDIQMIYDVVNMTAANSKIWRWKKNVIFTDMKILFLSISARLLGETCNADEVCIGANVVCTGGTCSCKKSYVPYVGQCYASV